jgi:serine/threonine protein kinase
LCLQVLNTPRQSTSQKVYSELQILHQLQHPNITKFIGWSRSPVGRSIIFLELASMSLEKYLSPSHYRPPDDMNQNGANISKVFTPVSHVFELSVDIAAALEYLHSLATITGKAVVHRELRPQNCLLFECPEQEGGVLVNIGGGRKRANVKLTNFGYARTQRAHTRQIHTPKTRHDIPYWMAPECIRHLEAFDEKADVYSFGILLWELWCRQKPFVPTPMGATLVDSQMPRSSLCKSVVAQQVSKLDMSVLKSQFTEVIYLEVVRASGLGRANTNTPFGLSNPFAKLVLKSQGKFQEIGKTPRINRTLDPDWQNQALRRRERQGRNMLGPLPSVLSAGGSSSKSGLVLEVWDFDLVGDDDFLGVLILEPEQLRDLVKGACACEGTDDATRKTSEVTFDLSRAPTNEYRYNRYKNKYVKEGATVTLACLKGVPSSKTGSSPRTPFTGSSPRTPFGSLSSRKPLSSPSESTSKAEQTKESLIQVVKNTTFMDHMDREKQNSALRLRPSIPDNCDGTLRALMTGCW